MKNEKGLYYLHRDYEKYSECLLGEINMNQKEKIEAFLNRIDLTPYLERVIEQIVMSEGLYIPVSKTIEDLKNV